MYREAIRARAGDIWFWGKSPGVWVKLQATDGSRMLTSTVGEMLAYFRRERVPLCFVKQDEPLRVCDVMQREEPLHCA
jgi:hypothetical protein